MYNLLIVDDEPVITDNISDLFVDWKNPELDIYKAYSGKKALECMEKIRIDIVLTDICMPEIDGLQVQRTARELWPGCKVIFLTGYEDFDYIHTALRNGGSDYILKSESEKVLLQAVKKAVEEIERERREEQLVERAKLNLSLAIPLLQSKLLSDLIEGGDFDEQDIRRHFTELEIPLDSGLPVFMMAGQVDFWDKETTTAQKLKLVYGVRDFVEKYIRKTARVLSVTYEHTKMLWFIQPFSTAEEEENDWERVLVSVKGSMALLQSMCHEIYGISVSFVVSSSPVTWKLAAQRFDSLRRKLSSEAGLSHGRLLIDEVTCPEPSGCSRYWEEEMAARSRLRKVSLLKSYLENGERELYFALYKDITDTVGNNRDLGNDLCIEAYFSISVMLLSHINRWKIMDSIGTQISLDKLTNIVGHSSWEELVDFLRRVAECIFEQKNQESFDQASRVFRFIRTYTEQHLDGDLSLTKFAELLHFHPFYLSRLFKQVTGKNLTEYISSVKAAKARDLLKNSNIKVSEIAALLGFETASYFTKFFKKCSGLTPQEYRNSL